VSCVFCAIIAEQAPASVAFENDTVIVFADIAPVNPGHQLVVPKVHAVGLEDLDPATGAEMYRVASGWRGSLARGRGRRVAPRPRPCQAPVMTVDELAAATCVDPADVRVVLAWIDEGAGTSPDDIPTTVATAVHQVLNPESQRTVLELYYKARGI